MNYLIFIGSVFLTLKTASEFKEVVYMVKRHYADKQIQKWLDANQHAIAQSFVEPRMAPASTKKSRKKKVA